MARRYSGRHGKSGSKRPLKRAAPAWVRYKGKEVELLVIKIAKEGNSSSKIGLLLRDTYGIPSVKLLTGKSINEILKEKNLNKEIPEDLMALMKKNIHVTKHLEANKSDMVAKRGLQLTDSKIKRLVKYYKANNVLNESWTYDPEKIKLIIE